MTLAMSELHLGNVYLLTESSGMPMALPRITLDFIQSGVMVSARDSGEAKLLPWTNLVSITASSRAETPDGEKGMLIEITTAEKVHRFVVPVSSIEEESLGKAIEAMNEYCAAVPIDGPSSTKQATPMWQVVVLGVLLILLAVVIGLIVAKAKGAF
ncbi:MAG: hypothetical protein M1519_05750 [Actinobacteria bacterium]|jgi:hypothetical protein|nr:hypothetical protein [Actinomycetota bacterium]